MPHDSTILVVDDDESFLVACARALHRVGYTVLVAHTGASALEWLRVSRHRIDLLIVDVRLPDVPGPDVVRRAGVSAPVLYISGAGDPAGLALQQREVSEPALLLKPFQLRDLTERVATLLGRSPAPAPLVA